MAISLRSTIELCEKLSNVSPFSIREQFNLHSIGSTTLHEILADLMNAINHPPTVEFSASDSFPELSQSITLSWSINQGGSSCKDVIVEVLREGSWVEFTSGGGLSHSIQVNPPSFPSTYTFRCKVDCFCDTIMSTMVQVTWHEPEPEEPEPEEPEPEEFIRIGSAGGLIIHNADNLPVYQRYSTTINGIKDAPWVPVQTAGGGIGGLPFEQTLSGGYYHQFVALYNTTNCSENLYDDDCVANRWPGLKHQVMEGIYGGTIHDWTI